MKTILGVGISNEDALCLNNKIPNDPQRAEVLCNKEGTPYGVVFFGRDGRSKQIRPCRFNVSSFRLLKKRSSGVMVYTRDKEESTMKLHTK